MADLEALKRAEAKLPAAPWELWTSCSFRRITGPDGRDGGVLSAYNQRSDGHPDLSMPEDQLFALVELRNALPDLISRLEEAEKALEDIRHTLLDIADRLEEEGDRTFLGSTNDGDEIKTIAQNLDARRWADVRRARAAHKRLKGGTDAD